MSSISVFLQNASGWLRLWLLLSLIWLVVSISFVTQSFPTEASMRADYNQGTELGLYFFGDPQEIAESCGKLEDARQVLRVARKYFEFSDKLASELASALEYRNYLAHGFFVRHDIDLLSESGKRKMIDELVEIASYIKQVDRQMDPIWMSAWEHLGVTREWVAEQMNRYVQERQQEATGGKSTV